MNRAASSENWVSIVEGRKGIDRRREGSSGKGSGRTQESNGQPYIENYVEIAFVKR